MARRSGVPRPPTVAATVSNGWRRGLTVVLLALVSYAHSVTFTTEFDGFLRANLHRFTPVYNLRHLLTRRYFDLSLEGTYRPVVTLSYVTDSVVWQGGDWGFHFTNTLLHAGVAALVWCLIRGVVRGKGAAFFPAALFAIHPLTQRPVCCFSSRGDILATLWVVAALVCHQQSHGPRARRRWTLGASACFVVALLSKENAVVFPLLALAQDFAFARREIRTSCRRYGAYGLALLTVAAARYLLFHDVVTHALATGQTRYPIPPSQTLWSYATWLLFPLHIHPGPAKAVPPALSLASVWQSIALCVSALPVVFLLARRYRVAMWGASWVAIAALPVANFIPMPNPPDSRLLYMPLIGWCIMVGAVIRWMSSTPCRNSVRPLAATMLLALALWSLGDHGRWSSSLVLYRTTVRDYPASEVARGMLGDCYLHAGQRTRAKRQYESRWNASLGGRKAQESLAHAYLKLGLVAKAEGLIEHILREHPDDAKAWQLRGLALWRTGRLAEGVKALKRATELEPRSAAAWVNLGQALYDRGQTGPAIEALAEAARLAPLQAEVWYVMSKALYKAGRVQEAGEAAGRFQTLSSERAGFGRHRRSLAARDGQSGPAPTD